MKRQSEQAEQETFIAWCRKTAAGGFAPLKFLHASLNGVALTMQQARQAKRAGMVKGVPDLFLPYPAHGYHGLFIEMKTYRGKLSPEQKDMRRYLQSVGYMVAVPRSWHEAKAAVLSYVRGRKEPDA